MFYKEDVEVTGLPIQMLAGRHSVNPAAAAASQYPHPHPHPPSEAAAGSAHQHQNSDTTLSPSSATATTAMQRSGALSSSSTWLGTSRSGSGMPSSLGRVSTPAIQFWASHDGPPATATTAATAGVGGRTAAEGGGRGQEGGASGGGGYSEGGDCVIQSLVSRAYDDAALSRGRPGSTYVCDSVAPSRGSGYACDSVAGGDRDSHTLRGWLPSGGGGGAWDVEWSAMGGGGGGEIGRAHV